MLEEADDCIMILDRNQAARGHLPILPKRHVELWHELNLSEAVEMSAKAHRWVGVLVAPCIWRPTTW
jgi:diadenosine tetraphosphate (Ap4A) HIT family hydrolase